MLGFHAHSSSMEIVRVNVPCEYSTCSMSSLQVYRVLC